MRISDWSSDVCSSDLPEGAAHQRVEHVLQRQRRVEPDHEIGEHLRHTPASERGWQQRYAQPEQTYENDRRERKSVVEGKSVTVRVGLGGRRIHKKKQENTNKLIDNTLFHK